MSEYTVKQFAVKEQVDERTVRRWIFKGAVQIRRTPSGGIRVVDSSRVVLLNMTNHDKLGHPSS